MRKIAGLAFTSLSLLLFSCAEGTEVKKGPDVVQPDVVDVSKPLTEMVKLVVPPDYDLDRAHEAEPTRQIPHDTPFYAQLQGDPVQQNTFGVGQIPTTLANFEGMGTGLPGFQVNSAPPDTDGDIGPNHYVQIVNESVTIFNRQGQVVLGPTPTNTFWTGMAGMCSNTNDGDGTVRYDRIADRWVIAQFSVNGGNGPFFQCIAVSTTSDPTGTYNRYQFSYTAFNDYPKMGLWPDAYYTTFNMFPNNTFAGAKVCAMDRAKMLTGATATMQCFDTSNQWGGILASDLDGATPPPAGSPNYLVAVDVNQLGYWKMHTDWTTPANSTFTGPTLIPTAAFTALCNGGTCVKEPSGTLDSLADRLMNRFVYRNFGDHEALLVTHAVTAGTGGGVRWYEIRNPSSPTIFQQGTYAPDSAYRWMSSGTFDKAGNIAIGFSVSSSTINPSIRYTGRLVTDAAGTMGQGEGTIVNGTGSQNGGLSRWGDYSSMNIDPTDDCTFWFTEEYEGATGSFNWRTRVASFKFPNCGTTTTNDFSITPNPTSQTVAAGSSTSYQINTAVTAGNAQNVALTVTGLPNGVTGSFSPSSISSGQSSTLTLTAATTATAGSTQFTIVGTGASVTHQANATVTVTNTNQPPSVTITAPTNGSTVSGTITVSATASDPDGTVASVRFDLPNGTSVTDTSAPFSTTFDTHLVPDGAGTVFKATAVDNMGASSTTQQVSVTVQNGGGTCINNTFNATGLPKSIPDNNATGITSNLAVVGNGTVASLSLSLHITHTWRGDLVVTLISPSGTSFVVSNRSGGSADNIVITNQSIPNFNGEVAAGTWQVKVQDLAALDVGTLDSWSLAIVGNCTTSTPWSASGTPNLATKDNGTVCTNLNVTATGGDASLAKLDIAGRHDYRSILRGTLAHGGVTKTAFPTGTFPSGPGNFSFVNRAVAGFTGDASGTWTLCIVDTDGFGDTGVLNTWSVHN